MYLNDLSVKQRENIETLANKLKTTGDPNRLKILCYLFKTKKPCVSEIAKNLNISVAIASHHLLALAKSGLLVSVKEGKKNCYSLAKNDFTKDIKSVICKYK